MQESVIWRFWQYVDQKKESECWPWTGSVSVRGGYGQLNDRGRLLKSHRLAFILKHGEIPKGAMVCHSCNNPLCCNANHLYAGDNLTNTADKIKAGTQFRFPIYQGEKHSAAKLTEADVKWIRSSSAPGRELAKALRVTPSTISAIRKRKIWKHI